LKAAVEMPPAMTQLANSRQAAEATLIQAVGAHHFYGLSVAKRLRKPLVWQLHSDILKPALRQIMSRVIARNSDVIMTNGRSVARSFWGDKSAVPNHFVFYAPVDIQKFRPDSDRRHEARSALGLDNDTILVGTVGNRVWQKNHQLQVEIARQLSSLYPRVRFVVFGGVHEPYRHIYEQEVMRPANALNADMPNYFRFIDPSRNVAHWIQALDVFVLTSHAEGVPIALFEAMSAGKPVVSSNVGSVSEVIDDGKTGSLCAPGDLRAFAGKLKQIIENVVLREDMAASARKRIVERFGLPTVISAHVDAHEYAIQRNAEKARPK